MSSDISKELMCVYMRNGVEIWLEKERANELIKALILPNAPQFMKFDGRLLNRADLTGIFNAEDMAILIRKKNGQWQCKYQTWHEKRQECECRPQRPTKNEYGFESLP